MYWLFCLQSAADEDPFQRFLYYFLEAFHSAISSTDSSKGKSNEFYETRNSNSFFFLPTTDIAPIFLRQ